MNILELFAGSRSIGITAELLGMNVFSVDWNNYPKINLQIDIENLQLSDIPFIPDMIWASPDCTSYSIAAISTHRNGVEPKTEYAKKCDNVNNHFINLIQQWQEINPNLIYFIENPRGMLRKMPFMQKFTRYTIWYCQYGDERAKPTDIWTNSKSWIPKPICYNGNPNCHHISAPRGSRTGTQGRKNHFERSKIPSQLCYDVLKSLNEPEILYGNPINTELNFEW
jgi:hypothetical protein